MGWGSSNISIAGQLKGASNVSRRSFFTFTPTQSTPFPYNWNYLISLPSYITAIGRGSNMYVYRIKLWHNSGDFGDTGESVVICSNSAICIFPN